MPGKLGLGLYRFDHRLAGEVAQSGATTCLLFTSALGHAATIKQQAPNMLIVGRQYYGTEDEQVNLINMAVGDRNAYFYDQGRSLASIYPAVDVWQGLNEVFRPENMDRLPKQIEAEKAFTDGVMSMGKTSCVLNISTGAFRVPSDPEWQQFAALLAGAEQEKTGGSILTYPGVRFLGLHEYGASSSGLMRDLPEWYSLRHRAFFAGLDSLGIRYPQLLITEYGQEAGWRPVGEGVAIEDYLWFGQQINPDPLVYGTCNFLHGRNNDDWINFDTDGTGIYPAVVAFNTGAAIPPIPGPGPGPGPQPVPTPTPTGRVPLGLVLLGAAAAVGSTYLLTEALLDEGG